MSTFFSCRSGAQTKMFDGVIANIIKKTLFKYVDDVDFGTQPYLKKGYHKVEGKERLMGT